MTDLSRWHVAVLVAVVFVAAPSAMAQQTPHIGYVYPAGGRQGTTFEVTVGGQWLNGANEAHFSGPGLKATVVDHIRPVPRGMVNKLNQKIRELRTKYKLGFSQGRQGKGGARPAVRPAARAATFAKANDEFKAYVKSLKLREMDMKAFGELRKKLSDPKRQPNAQIAEIVLLKVTLAAGAKAGEHELRLKTWQGVTNPLFFHVSQTAEYNEHEPNDKTPDAGLMKNQSQSRNQKLPVVINGQIMPGDVDRFRFQASKGMQLVAHVSARELVPYLADAVPGWFQATLSLSDADGNDVAYSDDYRFHVDPVVQYKIPADGEYVLEIKDSIYRGREDFVYRIALGPLPFVTSIFPLGGRAGEKTAVEIHGWNLPRTGMMLDASGKGPGIMPVSVWKNKRTSNPVPFALDVLPESLESESNNGPRDAQRIKLPLIVNGRIGRVGDVDVFSFTARAGDQVVAEVHARRLESPLDSLLKLTDAKGKLLAVNDDHVDKGAGLTTHQADSRLTARLPADGTYLVHLNDTQNKGSNAHAYRLRVSLLRPDFELRVVPSGISARAGMSVPITVYALRKDGFAGAISLKLKGQAQGFTLGGGVIPPGRDKVRLTLTVPQTPRRGLVSLDLDGLGVIGGQTVVRRAVPAEDMMQAFLYRHLVPARNWVATVSGKARYGSGMKVLANGPVKLSATHPTRVRVSGPRGQFMKQVRLALNEPPKGIKITKVTPDPQGGLAFDVSVDGKEAKVGLRGNLIVDAFMETAPRSRDGKVRPKRRMPLGALPAIQFEVVAAAPRSIGRR